MATHRGGAGATLTHPGDTDPRQNSLLLRLTVDSLPRCLAPPPSSPLLPPTACGHQADLPTQDANPQAGENSWIRQLLKAPGLASWGQRDLLTSCHRKPPQENPPPAQQETLLAATWIKKPDSHFLPGRQPSGTGPSPGLHISKTWGALLTPRRLGHTRDN